MKPQPIICLLVLFIVLSACQSTTQDIFWATGIGAALREQESGNSEAAEAEFKRALWRAENHLDQKTVSDSLLYIGSFYRQEGRNPEAIKYLKKSLTLEETLTGQSSERTGRRIAELAAAYVDSGYFIEARSLADRLKPLASLYQGQTRSFVDQVVNYFYEDPEIYREKISQLSERAETGDPEAICDLARYYEIGRGVEQNYQKAIELYEAAAQKDYLEAQFQLGVIYGRGIGVTLDRQKSREWFRIAAERGHEVAEYNYAEYLLYGAGGPKNREEAINWLKKSSAQGYPPATSLLKKIQE